MYAKVRRIATCCLATIAPLRGAPCAMRARKTPNRILRCLPLALLMISSSSLVLAEGHADRSPARVLESGMGMSFNRVQQPSDLRVDALGTGKPPTLSSFGGWVTLDNQVDDFGTSIAWCDFDSLKAVQLFYVNNTNTVKASLKVTTSSGEIVFADAGPFMAPSEGLWELYDVIGPLPPASYKVTGKLVQGTKVVGSQF